MELDAILNASPKVMLFGDFNAHHPRWNPGCPNTHGNTLYNWASAHALDIMAPTAPTYYAARGTRSILDIAFAKNLTLEDINSRLVKKPVIISPLTGRNGILYSDDEKAEEFKNNLEATFQENSEPYNDTIIELVESETYDFLANSSMQVPPLTSPAEISKIIYKLQNKKASGPDNIPNYALKLLPLNAITHLTKIINTCLKHRYFPTLWKSANVIMLPKPNQNHKLVNNYRPISFLCGMAKIYEKVILNRIKQHCDTINCIPPEQCGFRNNHSTIHQLIRVTNIINEGYTYKFFTVGVFLDVKRAFDKMWHDGLIYKTIKLNFPEYLVKIVHNFLKNRSFRVKVNFNFSNKGFPEAGCLQGSCLSPHLYNIYTYDFPHHPSVSICLFTDDGAVLTQGANLKYTQCTLQRYLHTLESWLTDWRIAVKDSFCRDFLSLDGCTCQLFFESAKINSIQINTKLK
ncbi:RNA-directed DNA polymerase from mobile element jockey [Trichonephila clavipes]|nr:RNA-directed DNA polymerase from mobile element jockey [Trichonephila clavipes]